LTNTIAAYSPSGGNCAGSSIASSKFTFSSDNTCGLPPGDTIKGSNPNSLDPLLSALGNFVGPTLVHMPSANSPAVDGVVGSGAASIEQRGVARPQGVGYDIGAVEYTPRLNQTINFAPLPDRTLSQSPFNVSATASSALAVTFTAGPSNVCTVSG